MRIALVAVAALIFVSACNNKKNDDYKKITGDPYLYARTVKELNNVVMQNNFPRLLHPGITCMPILRRMK